LPKMLHARQQVEKLRVVDATRTLQRFARGMLGRLEARRRLKKMRAHASREIKVSRLFGAEYALPTTGGLKASTRQVWHLLPRDL